MTTGLHSKSSLGGKMDLELYYLYTEDVWCIVCRPTGQRLAEVTCITSNWEFACVCMLPAPQSGQ